MGGSRVVGRCSICNGDVTIPELWLGVQAAHATCSTCGATAAAPELPVIPMTPPRKVKPWGWPRVPADPSWYVSESSDDSTSPLRPRPVKTLSSLLGTGS